MLRAPAVMCASLILLTAQSSPAAACSAGPDFDPRDHTQVVVLGRARSVELGAATNTGFSEATVTLDVIHAYRGLTTSPLRFVDPSSAIRWRDASTGLVTVMFAGGGGACGTIDADPVGKYVLIALARGEDSRWYANRLYGARYTNTPDYAFYRAMLGRHGVRVPFLVTGPATDVSPHGPVLAP